MSHYLHHIIFDPLSKWEEAKIDFAIAAVLIAIYMVIATIDEVKKW